MEAAFREQYAALAGELTSLAPLRSDSIETLAFPDRRNEAWKYTSVRKMLDGAAKVRTGCLGPMEGAVDLMDIVDSLDGFGTVADDDGFPALNTGLFQEGAAIVASEGQTLTARLSARVDSDVVLPRFYVHAAAGSTVDVAFDFELTGGLMVPVVEVLADAGSTVRLTSMVSGSDGRMAGQIAVKVGQDATVAVQSVVTGGRMVRVEMKAEVDERGFFDSTGLALGRNKDHCDQHLEILHQGTGCRSAQLFRSILDDRARNVFTGEVRVGVDVTGTDAQQSANGLLLSDGCSAVTRPWLEIHNDEVTASHGAAVGRLDPEALFYLRQRGMDQETARRMLTRAFAHEVVATIPEAARGPVEDAVEAWLSA